MSQVENIFLTGATGFLGAYLLIEIRKQYPDAHIKALRRPTSKLDELEFVVKRPWENAPEAEQNARYEAVLSKVTWIEGDLSDYEGLVDALSNIDTVCHAAASVSFSKKNAKATIAANAIGTENLVNAALVQSVQRMWYVSSVATLDRLATAGATEEAWFKGKEFANPYAESKYRAEMEVWRGEAEGLQVLIINPSVLIGPGFYNKGSLEVFSTLSKGLAVYPPGANAFVDVRDVAECFITLSHNQTNYGHRYLCTGFNLYHKELLWAAADALGAKRPKIKLSKGVVRAGVAVSSLIAAITRSEPFITKEIAESALQVYSYNSEKLERVWGKTYRPLEETLSDVARCYAVWAKRYSSVK